MFGKVLQWVQTNLTSLGLSLLLALTVWIVANQEQNPVEERDLPTPVEITIEGLEPGLVITNNYAKTTTVRLRAQRNTWFSLSAENVLVTADLSGLGPGTHQVELDVHVAAQAIYVLAKPDRVRIELEEERVRDLPIRLEIEGQPAIGYSIGSATLTPSTVTVRGPRSRVERISEVRVTVAVEGLREGLANDVPLVALDSDGNPIEGVMLTPSKARVVVPVEQQSGYKYVSIIPDTIGSPATGYFITGFTVTPPQLTVQGDPDVLDGMPPLVRTQPIDLTGLTDDLIIEVQLALPPGVTPIDVQVVEVLVSIAAQPGTRTLNIPIEITGLGSGLSAKLNPTQIAVFLSGPLPILDALSVQDDVSVTLDLSGFGPGTHQISPQIEVLQDSLVVESYFPIVIEVEIRAGVSPGGE